MAALNRTLLGSQPRRNADGSWGFLAGRRVLFHYGPSGRACLSPGNALAVELLSQDVWYKAFDGKQ